MNAPSKRINSSGIGYWFRVRALLLAAGLLVGILVALPPRASAVPTVLTFASSGWDAGNFQNVVAIAQDTTQTTIVGGDQSGLHRWVNSPAKKWTGVNQGLTVPGSIGDSPSFAVASIMVKSGDPTTIYVAGGREGHAGGFYASTDGGLTWSRRSQAPLFSGIELSGSTLARPVGNLLGQSSGKLFAATLNGLWRSGNGGNDWEQLGSLSSALRGLAVDPNTPTTIYLATSGQGVYKAINADSCVAAQCSITPMTGSPTNPEELVALADGSITYLYAAAGLDGMYRYDTSSTNWSTRNGTGSTYLPLGTTKPLWASLAGVGTGGTATLYVGARDPVDKAPGDGRFDAIFKSTDGGATGSPATNGSISTTICDSSPSRSWWETTSDPDFMLGGSKYYAMHIAIDPADTGRVLVAGNSGVWSTPNGGSNWCPLVNGLMVSQARDIVRDPLISGRYYAGSADFGFFYSTNSMASVTQQDVSASLLNVTDIAVGADSKVYVVNGNDGQPLSWDVLKNSDPTNPANSWTTTGLDLASDGMPSGLAVKGGGSSAILVVGVQGSGIWQYTSASGWQKRSTGAMQNGDARASTAWLTANGSQWVYLYDSYSGLWQSHDDGASWVNVWSNTSGHAGYLAADPNDGNRLYLSVEQEGVWKIDPADQTSITRVAMGSLTYPGPIAVKSDGTVYVTEFMAEGVSPNIASWASGSTSWTELGDAVYKGSGYVPVNLVIGADGKIYVAVSAGGVIIGT